MATTLHTFMDIFNQTFEGEKEPIRLKEIVIPIIQRDYAQGRENTETNRVRSRFLDSLYKAITVEPITLDFVYGDIDETGRMTPLDGQQRLTTLFLLHWYAAKKCNVPAEDYAFLKCFSYETRYSARDFCDLLVEYKPTFDCDLKSEIIDQHWFPLDWKKDPTIKSMLVMLNAIQNKFADVDDLWEKLKDNAISFYFLPIKDMGLTDELYIKMNSRGKPLTMFEHFKAELESNLNSIDTDAKKRIMEKIDIAWTDMLWIYRGSDNITDDEFLRYFRFICDTICYRAGDSPQDKSGDEFDLLAEYFSSTAKDVDKNIKTLEDFFDCWCKKNLNDESPAYFLNRFLSYRHEYGKVKIETRYAIDIFEDCLRNYADLIGGRNRRFPLNRYVVLYAIVTYLQNRDTITEDDFARRLRIINNLTQNSEYEISDSANRTSGNRMPAIIKQVDSVIINGTFDDTLDPNFNAFQIEEEKHKLQWCVENPDKVEELFALEDHELLFGQIGIVGTENAALFDRFESLFQCSRDAIDCALLASGYYLQTERNGWRHQLGSSAGDLAWKSLFHNSANDGYEKTKQVLVSLLSKEASFTTEKLHAIATRYIEESEAKSEFDWRYYYIKYKSFRPGRFGKYSWLNYSTRPYEMLTMWTEKAWSSNARQPFLYEIDAANINADDNGQTLRYGDKLVKCLNSAFVVCDAATKTEFARIDIAQNSDSIDTENRIEKGRTHLKALVDGVHFDAAELRELALELNAEEETQKPDKFSALKEYLESAEIEEMTLTFQQIEEIIGDNLCASAYKYSAYWHPSATHTMPNTIMAAGYKVAVVDIQNQQITVLRK